MEPRAVDRPLRALFPRAQGICSEPFLAKTLRAGSANPAEQGRRGVVCYTPVCYHVFLTGMTRKKKKLVFILVLLCVLAIMWCFMVMRRAAPQPPAEPARPPVVTHPQPQHDEEKAEAMVQQLNQVMFVLTRILEYNDIRVLDEADALLSESYINLDVFNDESLIRMVTDIRRTIRKLQVDAGNRRIMEQCIAARRANAIWTALSGVSSPGGVTRSSPAGTAANVAVNLVLSSVKGYASYKKELNMISHDLEMQTWELDKEHLKTLSEFQSALFSGIAELVRAHRIPDVWRLSVQDSKALVIQLKGANPETVLRYLQDEATEQKYKHLPEYWYHRGMYEFKAAVVSEQAGVTPAGELIPEKARAAKKTFQHYQAQKLAYRRSRDAVNVAIAMLALLKDDHAAATAAQKQEVEKAILQQIQYIKTYSDDGDLANTWQDQFAIYTALISLGRRDEAYSHMELLLSRLENASSTIVQEDLKRNRSKRAIRGYAEPLSICTAALAADMVQERQMGNALTPSQKLIAIIDSEYAAFQAKAEWYGTISPEKQEKIVKDEIHGSLVESTKDGEVRVLIPWSFFMLEDIKCELWAYREGKGSPIVRVKEMLNKREFVANKAGEITKVRLTFDGGDELESALRKGNPIEVDVLHPRMPVGLVFARRSTQEKQDSALILKAVRYKQNASTSPPDGRFDRWVEL